MKGRVDRLYLRRGGVALDKRPLVIARCVDAAGVIMALNFGRDAAPAFRCIIDVGG